MTPLSGEGRGIQLDAPGFQARSDQDSRIALNTVSDDYFTTLGTPLMHGRAFTPGDRLGAPAVALLNQSAARHFFAGRDPIGNVVKANGYPYQIVGVVEDAKHANLREEAVRFLYVPVRQPMDRGFRMTLSIRTASHPPSLLAAVRRQVRDIGPDILITRTDTLVRQIDETLMQERVISTLATAFGVLALVLSAVGLYGVLAYALARRTREIGIRVALGALPRQAAWSILRQTLWLVAIGLAAGVPASMLMASLAERLLYGVTPTDAVTQAGAAVLLAIVAFVASYLPARRAGRIDPLAALRHE
jgi:predicted permease